MVNKSFLTEDGYKKLKEELEYLKKTKRLEVAKRIDKAREFGDLSENAEYQDAKEEQAFIEGRILEIEHLFKTSSVVDTSVSSRGDAIGIGSKIVVDFDGERKEFEIVGATDSDPLKGLISYNSPLGKSFVGKSKGDEFEVDVPRGIIKCKILDIK
ncbi:MAG TPA: transcription elongation factor GreA [bacterium]|jgi:transcription elongation factor GreA|nr:transcription elongation factor GreA [bacterium]HOG38189.1 transcription elongation factor GreA [bacterium]HQI03221.1 transcription elongation factor GreA [bacterium]